jgi:orotate phosphoribosyltransferase
MHVMILDDTWTTGSRTQSAALALRRYGARYVTVMVISRYLRPRFDNNAEFITARLRPDYSPDICPVTGGDCP